MASNLIEYGSPDAAGDVQCATYLAQAEAAMGMCQTQASMGRGREKLSQVMAAARVMSRRWRANANMPIPERLPSTLNIGAPQLISMNRVWPQDDCVSIVCPQLPSRTIFRRRANPPLHREAK
ncbi:hypothetical protein FHX14_000464 [Rhizobium sp. BK619]|uniref:hypothetical protein n=1 Tax=Rhizobium sp. BK619 TaxID=2586989 RepID=UPI00161EE363|nr:hypothetical protein [Rhizobium sp. BK619]MBB3644305.1 hypothetical protein [Rhizobium sp. BK619]